MAVAVAAGARVLRQSFSWSIIEREPGRYDFSLYDHFVANAARAGLGVLPILIDPPPFRSSRPATGARRGIYPPASNAEFAAFAQLLVRRYGPDGGFWRANPQLPQMPIRSWEVWNEPNLPQFWAAGPDPAAYAVMLKTVYAAIKAVDPGSRVISAGIDQQQPGHRARAVPARHVPRRARRTASTRSGFTPTSPAPTWWSTRFGSLCANCAAHATTPACW